VLLSRRAQEVLGEVVKKTDRMSLELARAIDALTYAFERTELDMEEQVCGDAAEVAWKLLRDAGWEPVVIGAPETVMGRVPEPYLCAGHEWVRVKDHTGEWNLDFAAQQFGKRLPFVTAASSPAAVALYGPGSIKAGPPYEVWDHYTVEEMIYPPVEWVDEAAGSVMALAKRWSDEDWLASLMIEFVRSFRVYLVK